MKPSTSSPTLLRELRAASRAVALFSLAALSTGCAASSAIHDAVPSILGSLTQLGADEDRGSDAASPLVLETPPESASEALDVLWRYCWSIRVDYYRGSSDEPPEYLLVAKYWVRSRPGSTIVQVSSTTYADAIEEAFSKVMGDIRGMDPSERALLAMR